MIEGWVLGFGGRRLETFLSGKGSGDGEKGGK